MVTIFLVEVTTGPFSLVRDVDAPDEEDTADVCDELEVEILELEAVLEVDGTTELWDVLDVANVFELDVTLAIDNVVDPDVTLEVEGTADVVCELEAEEV